MAQAVRKSSILSIVVTAVVVPGLFATVALPAYAFQSTDAVTDTSTALQQHKENNAQTLVVADAVAAASISRDPFAATSREELQAAAAAAAATSSVSSYLSNPPYPSFSLDALVQVALQYQGVPYVFGGSTPAGFDCSGFVMYVYSQFGISLGHGVGSQSRAGTLIDPAAALPGDVVILSDGSHDGIWMGGGMILDAPLPGGVVSVRPLWTDSYYIVRFGI